jgi:cephalosporin hydroxylase
MELNNNFTWKDIEGFFGSAYIYDQIIRNSSKFDTIVEIGCWYGKSTAYLVSRAKLAGRHPNVLCVENFMYYASDANNINRNLSSFVSNLTKCGAIDFVSIIRNAADVAAHNLKDESVFAVIIDSKYQDASILNDIRTWLPKIKPNGIIAGCDLHNNFSYIQKALQIAGIKKFEKHEEAGCTLWIAEKRANMA